MELKGLSGCKLELIDKHTVRKTSKDEKYNNRLKKQCYKQILFYKLILNSDLKGLRVPEVYNEGYNADGLYFFDMEFIPNALPVSSRIMQYNDWVYLLSVIQEFIYMEKNYTTFNRYSLHYEVYKKLNDCETLFVGKEPELVGTICHGDLTTDNILFQKSTNTFYLIDFLDNYVDHYYFDIATLFQYDHFFFKEEMIKWLLINIPDYFKYHDLLMFQKYKRMKPYITSDLIVWLDNKIKFYEVALNEGYYSTLW